MAAFVCPHCGDALTELELRDRRCGACGATVPAELSVQTAAPVETPQRSQDITDFDSVPRRRGADLQSELTWPDVSIHRGGSGETLAVLALLLPLLAQGLILACRFDSWEFETALSWGTILFTAVVLAVDAARLGTIDLQGTHRTGAVALFFGMILLWIIFYPAAFFRRRHFGRPNLGGLAILVAVFFVGVPFIQQFMRFGTLAGGLPSCTSREVITMVDDLIRKGPDGPMVQSISGHREISYDPVKQIRKGQCLVKTQAETLTAAFSVQWLNRKTGVYQVDVQPVVSEDPPSCTHPEVMALVERLFREGPNGHNLKTVAGHQETRYDRENKVRHGRCQATSPDWVLNVAYKVYWIDQKTGQYQVQLEP